MINGIHHPAIIAVDLERLADWYRDQFGFEKVWKYEAPDEHIAFLRARNGYLELFQYFEPAARLGSRRSHDESGLVHFAIDVDDIDVEYERLSAAGVEFTEPPMSVGALRYTFCYDPEGNCIELLELPNEKIPFHLSRADVALTTQSAEGDWAEVQAIGDDLIKILRQR